MESGVVKITSCELFSNDKEDFIFVIQQYGVLTLFVMWGWFVSDDIGINLLKTSLSGILPAIGIYI
jgi:hypothetical protein